MNNLIAFIPARSGSKSIPNKNVKELGGKPLIAWSIKSAFDSGVQRVFVDTDGEDVALVAKEHGAEVLMRPLALGGDEVGMFELLKNEIPRLDCVPEYVLLLQPTSPFRNSTQIKAAISLLLNNVDAYDSVIAVELVPSKYNPAQVIVGAITGPRMASGAPISQRQTRRQDFPVAYIPTGSIYLFKSENLAKGSIYGDKVMLMETEASVNINEPSDWEEAERIAIGLDLPF